MALRRVDLSTDVYFVCLNHAMCTEGEEIVGLLVGEVDEERVAHVVAVLILRRSDKRKDRVEISPEQLSNASTEAEKLACILKKPVRVVGWYHSHPKLTVYPSLVDVCTQESYQLMDEGFIGMIFSVFNPDPNKFGGRIQMICFQSQTVIIDCNVEKSHIEIPIQLVPSSNISDVCMNSVIQLPRFLCQEEQLAYQMANQVPLDYLTRLHNSSVYLRKMGQISEVICGPLLKMLEERILNNEMKRKRLQEKKKALTVMVEKARAEKIKKEKEMQEKIQKEQEHQEKSDVDQQSLFKEQELRALLIKKQKMREKSQLAMQEEELSHVENREMQIDSHIREQATQDNSHNKIQNDSDVVLFRDQEVPELNEQNEYVVEDQEMKELEIEEVNWQTQLQQQVSQSVADLQKQEGMPEVEIKKNITLEIEVSQKNACIEENVFKNETYDKREKLFETTESKENFQIGMHLIEKKESKIDRAKPKERKLQVKYQTHMETNLQPKVQDIPLSEVSNDAPRTIANSLTQSSYASNKSTEACQTSNREQDFNMSVNISSESNNAVESELIMQSDKLEINDLNAIKIDAKKNQNIALIISTRKDELQSNISDVLILNNLVKEQGAIASLRSDKRDDCTVLDTVVNDNVKEQKTPVQSTLTVSDKVNTNVLSDSFQKDLERQQNAPCASLESDKVSDTDLAITTESDYKMQKNAVSSANDQLYDNVLDIHVQKDLVMGQQATVQNISSLCDKPNTSVSAVQVKK